MNNARNKYKVHAEVLRTGSDAPDFDDAKAGHPLERRLNRLERVATSFRGRIEQRINNVLYMTFETADSALLGACEMQNRCAVLPQVSRQRLALRIGIHQALVRQRSKDGADNARDIASQLAVSDDGIIASGNVVAALNPDLRKIIRPMDDFAAEFAAYKVDWRSEIPTAAFGGESFWPANKGFQQIGSYLLLQHGLTTLELTEDNPVVTVGRDPSSDLVFVDEHVSRNHCRIEIRADCILLTDSSTNGTCIKPDDGLEFLVRNRSVVLGNKGMLFFGRPFKGERRGSVRFETY